MKKVACSERIKEALALKGSKPADLCAMTDISKATISQYINGFYEPSQVRIEIISRALNVNEAWLMGYDVPMERNKPITQKDDELIDALNNRPELRQLLNSLSRLDNEHLDAFMKIIGLQTGDQQD